MKIKKRLVFSIATFVLMFSINSCDIVDSINSYPVNIPISLSFSSSGSGNTVNETESFCINDREEYQEYSDEIKKIELVEMAFRTISHSPAELAGDVKITLTDGFANVLFEKNIPNAKASDYINSPYVLPITKEEIEVVNTYLDEGLTNNQTLCFNANLTIDITSGGSTHSISGAIDVVFEAETEL